MLLFIIARFAMIAAGKWISIHLMLLFIEDRDAGYIKERHFNTSHVTVYR